MSIANLAKEEYFEDVRRCMENKGFDFISMVQIDSREIYYHVRATYARVTSLFFGLPCKSLIVQMKFTEDDFWRPGFARSYWAISLYIQYKRDEVIFAMKSKSKVDIPLLEYELKVGGFRNSHYYSSNKEGFYQTHRRYEQENKKNIMHAEELSMSISILIKEVEPYLTTLFDKLQVTDFPPHYVFPRSEKIFWKRFNINKLRTFVIRPWGSDGI